MKKKVFKTIAVYVIASLGVLPSGLILWWLFRYELLDILRSDSLFEVGAAFLILLVVFCSFISSIMMLYYYHKVHARKCDGTEINAI